MTLFLDLDGPILDVRERYYAVHQALVGSAASRLSLDAFWDLKRDQTPIRDLLTQCGMPAEAAGSYSLGWRDQIEAECWLELDRIFDGIDVLLRHWQASHRLILVTLRQRPDLVRNQLDRLKLTPRFETILTTTPMEGPGWESKAKLIRSHSGFRQGAWVVGDTEIDIRAGKLVGLKTVGVLTGIRNRRRLEAENPDVVMDRLADLSRLLDQDI